MKPETREFPTKLAALMQEYNASIEVEGDSYYGGIKMLLEVKNPQNFDEHYEQWVAENPDKQYPFFYDSAIYHFTDYTELGCDVNSDLIEHMLK